MLALLPLAVSPSPGVFGAYSSFAERHFISATRMEPGELDSLLVRADGSRPPRLNLESGELRADIIEALGIGSLVAGLAAEVPVARLESERLRKGLIERRLIIEDAEVGPIEAVLLTPPGGPHPAILGLHGHHDDPEVFAQRYMGEALARKGYVVFLPLFRHLDCSASENRIARGLLEHGYSLMGLHVYESLVALRYLDSLDQAQQGNIGILSHSGGSSIANLVVRISDDVAAQVTDYRVDFRNRCGPEAVHCETVPALVRLATDINRGRDLSIPRLVVPYGFKDATVRRRILAFFDRVLKADPERDSSPDGTMFALAQDSRAGSSGI